MIHYTVLYVVAQRFFNSLLSDTWPLEESMETIGLLSLSKLILLKMCNYQYLPVQNSPPQCCGWLLWCVRWLLGVFFLSGMKSISVTFWSVTRFLLQRASVGFYGENAASDHFVEQQYHRRHVYTVIHAFRCIITDVITWTCDSHYTHTHTVPQTQMKGDCVQ